MSAEKMFNKNFKKNCFVIFLFSVLAYWPSFLHPNFVIWDDAVLYSGHSAAIDEWHYSAGLPFHLLLMRFIVWIDPTRAYIVFALFMVYYACNITIYAVMDKLEIFKNEWNVIAALLGAVAPLHFIRFMSNSMVYLHSIVIFVIGSYLFVSYLENRRKLFFASSLSLFTLASITASMPPLIYGATFLMVAVKDKDFISKQHLSARNILIDLIMYTKKYFPFIIMPLIVLVLHKTAFTPYGLYDGYNDVEFSYEGLKKGILANTIYPINLLAHFIIRKFNFVYFAGTSLFTYIYISKFKYKYIRSSSLGLFLASTFIYICAIFAYVAVGKGAVGIELASTRHQMTLLPVFGFMITAYISFFINKKLHIPITAFTIALFCTLSVSGHTAILRHAVLQDALVEKLKNAPDLKSYSTFIFQSDLDYGPWSDYVYNFLLKKAFGSDSYYGQSWNSETVLAPEDIDRIKIPARTYKRYKNYNCSEWNEYGPVVYLKLDIREKAFLKSPPIIYRYAFWRTFNRDKYAVMLRALVTMEYQAIEMHSLPSPGMRESGNMEAPNNAGN